MESFEEVNKYLKDLEKIELKDIFPKTIEYPGQKLEFNKLNNTKSNTNNNLSNSNVPMNKEISLTNKLQTKSDFSTKRLPIKEENLINKQTSYKIENKMTSFNFSGKEQDQVYEVFIEGDMIIGCGGQFIKIYSKRKIEENSASQPEITFHDPEEDFYAMTYSEFYNAEDERNNKLMAAGGKKSIIRVFEVRSGKEMHQLIGHRNEIYDIKFCPVKDKSFLLVSASKDFSVRLWNAFNGVQICIFGGLEGHVADVSSVDWHLSAQYIVSGSLDYSIKIWQINNQIENNIEISKKIEDRKAKKELKFKTIIRSIPIFSCNSIHDNYVDCVKFNGNLILSKSVDGVVLEWMPYFNKESDTFFIINSYVFTQKELVWFMKFDIDVMGKEVLGVGNTEGNFFLFSLKEDSQSQSAVYDNNYMFRKPVISQKMTDNDLIRAAYIDRTSDYFVLGHGNGKISLGKLIKN